MSLESFRYLTVSLLLSSTLRNGEKPSLDFNANGYSLICTKQFRKERKKPCEKKVNLIPINPLRGGKHKGPCLWHLEMIWFIRMKRANIP